MAVAVDNGPSVYTQLKQGVNEIQSDERIRKSLWHHAYTPQPLLFPARSRSRLLSRLQKRSHADRSPEPALPPANHPHRSWCQPYEYKGSHSGFVLRSAGPDGKANTLDDMTETH